MGQDLGKKIASKEIGKDRVTIYSNGYAKIGLIGASKLKSISGKTDFHVAPTTYGQDGILLDTRVNVWEEGGTAYLSIVTEDWVKTITIDNPSKREMKEFWQVVTAGEGVCGTGMNDQRGNLDAHSGSISEELQKLETLLESGVISKGDFKKAKKKLIN